MIQTIDERLVLARPEGPDFFQDAIAAYGREDARNICEAIIASVFAAGHHVPLLAPVNGLKLKVNSNLGTGRGAPYQAFADARDNTVTLILHPEGSPSDIIGDLPRVMRHESTHISHYQHNPRIYVDRGKFAWAICEGIAQYGENSWDIDYDPAELFDYDPELVRRTEDALIDVLFDPDKDEAQGHYEFLFGDTSFPSRGYRVGQYLVENMVVREDYSLLELLQFPLDYYRWYAEYEL